MTQKSDDLAQPRTLAQYARLVLTGFAMGAADIVPGVSGGTMAFILGVYENLIDAIKSFNLDAIRLLVGLRFKALMDQVSFRFLLALGLGLLSAILSAVEFSQRDNGRSEWPRSALRIFLRLGAGVDSDHWRPKCDWNMLSTVSYFCRWHSSRVSSLLMSCPREADHSYAFLFISGMIAITAMILPGISGSFMLLILGQYDYVLTAVSNRDLPPIIVVGLGADSWHNRLSPVCSASCWRAITIWRWRCWSASWLVLFGRFTPGNNVSKATLTGTAISAVCWSKISRRTPIRNRSPLRYRCLSLDFCW